MAKVTAANLNDLGLVIQAGGYSRPPEFCLSVCLLAILLLIKSYPTGRKKKQNPNQSWIQGNNFGSTEDI